jgi:DNA-binding GntR family transcriptional regulator
LTAFSPEALSGADLVRTRRTTQQLVHDVLHEAILSGHVQAGARLIQDDLAAQFKVSRVPVREALLQLEAEGLIKMEAHRGARVSTPTLAEIEENLEMRKLLLIPSVERAVPLLTDAQIDTLQSIVGSAGREDAAELGGTSHANFYAAMLAPLDRPKLVEMVVRLEREIERFCVPGGNALPGHDEIMTAVRARDGRQTAALVKRHMEHYTDAALQAIRRASA